MPQRLGLWSYEACTIYVTWGGGGQATCSSSTSGKTGRLKKFDVDVPTSLPVNSAIFLPSFVKFPDPWGSLAQYFFFPVKKFILFVFFVSAFYFIFFLNQSFLYKVFKDFCQIIITNIDLFKMP